MLIRSGFWAGCEQNIRSPMRYRLKVHRYPLVIDLKKQECKVEKSPLPGLNL